MHGIKTISYRILITEYNLYHMLPPSRERKKKHDFQKNGHGKVMKHFDENLSSYLGNVADRRPAGLPDVRRAQGGTELRHTSLAKRRACQDVEHRYLHEGNDEHEQKSGLPRHLCRRFARPELEIMSQGMRGDEFWRLSFAGHALDNERDRTAAARAGERTSDDTHIRTGAGATNTACRVRSTPVSCTQRLQCPSGRKML